MTTMLALGQNREVWMFTESGLYEVLMQGRMTFAADKSVTSYKLDLMCERLGIELNDALSDVTATLNVALVCSNRMRNNGGGSSTIHTGEKSRNYNIKKYMIRLAVYELTKLIAPNNVCETMRTL